MKPSLSAFIVTLVILVTGLSSCKRETSCEGCKGANKPPVAIAGQDKSIGLPIDSVLLDGTASSDPDGTIIQWQWSKIAGPVSLNLITPNTTQTIAGSLTQGAYLFELKVTDNSGASGRDTVQITVSNPTNRPPVAHAGPDQTIILPNNSADLDGSASSDPDNNIISYLWRKISGPASFGINNSNSPLTPIFNLEQGIYTVELKATDAGGLFDLDTVRIEVKPELVTGNVLFFFRDPTGSLDAANISVIENFTPQTILARVKIANFPDANIEGVWALNVTPWCPIASIYFDATSFGTFNLPPGTYTWTAESVTTNISSFPGVPGGFEQYWSTPHSASGTITVVAGTNCMIKEIIF